jgi:hypothetical protein
VGKDNIGVGRGEIEYRNKGNHRETDTTTMAPLIFIILSAYAVIQPAAGGYRDRL